MTNSPEANREAKLVPRGKWGSDKPERAGKLAARLANWLGVKLTGHETRAGAAALFLPPLFELAWWWWLVVAEEEEGEEEEVIVALLQVEEAVEGVAWRDPFAYAVWCCWPADGSVIAVLRPATPPFIFLIFFCFFFQHVKKAGHYMMLEEHYSYSRQKEKSKRKRKGTSEIREGALVGHFCLKSFEWDGKGDKVKAICW